MQLLLRQPARHLLDHSQEAEVAASPDSPGREQWQWDVRLSRTPATGPGALSEHLLGAGLGDHHVNVRFDPSIIVAEIERRSVGDIEVLWRDELELCVAIMEAGTMKEGSFLVEPGDVMVWEGDDPRTVALAPQGSGTAEFVLIRIARRDGGVQRWVP